MVQYEVRRTVEVNTAVVAVAVAVAVAVVVVIFSLQGSWLEELHIPGRQKLIVEEKRRKCSPMNKPTAYVYQKKMLQHQIITLRRFRGSSHFQLLN